jgi:hypothetical protein
MHHGILAKRLTHRGIRLVSMVAGPSEASGADLPLLFQAHEGSDA